MSPRISIRLLAAQSDRRLAGLAGEGHERAFEALVQRYRRPLQRYCMRMRLSDARAEDVLQQAFLQAWMAFARGADVRDVRPWLYRIVHNVAVNSLRAGGEAHRELTDAAQAQASLAGESDLQRAMDVHDALAGVAALPQMQQQAIFLTAVDGQSHDEVASVLGISEGAVRGLLYRARTTLRSAAAALTPPQLIEWAVGGGGAAAPTAERIAELSAGGGAAGLGGLLLKGAVVAVTAGAVATGATVASSDGQGAKPTPHRSHATTVVGGADAADRATGSGGALALPHNMGREGSRTRSEGARHPRSGRAERSHSGRDRSGSSDDRLVSAVGDDGSHGGPSATSGSGSGASDDRQGGSSGGADGSGGGSGSVTSGKGGQRSGSGSAGGGSGHSGGDDAQSTPQAAPVSEPSVAATPVVQPPTSSGSGSDDASATAGASSGSGSSESGSGSASGTKGGSGTDG